MWPLISMHCDCQVTIVIAKNKSYDCKSENMKLRHDIVKHLLRDEIIFNVYVKSEINLT